MLTGTKEEEGFAYLSGEVDGDLAYLTAESNLVLFILADFQISSPLSIVSYITSSISWLCTGIVAV